jgi:hypothetical protein
LLVFVPLNILFNFPICVPQASLQGEAVREAKVRSSCIYSLVAATEPDMTVAAGASSRIDVLSHALEHNHAALHFPL